MIFFYFICFNHDRNHRRCWCGGFVFFVYKAKRKSRSVMSMIHSCLMESYDFIKYPPLQSIYDTKLLYQARQEAVIVSK